LSNKYQRFEDKIYHNATKNGIPIAGQFELTSRCNFACKMCYVCKNSNNKEALEKEYSAKEWIRLAEECRDAGMLHLLLTGGEVFLRKDFFDIYEQVSNMGFIISIFTNGALITPQIARLLGQRPPSQVEVTVYGASNETYMNVCGDPSGYSKTVSGIENLLAEGVAVSLKTTIIKQNENDYDSIFDFSEAHGIGLKHVKYISPSRVDSAGFEMEHRLNPENQVKINTHASNRFFEWQKRLDGIKKFANNDNIPFDEHADLGSEDDHPFKCASGKCAFWVTWDGRMTPCALMNEPFTRPFEDGFMIAWGELMKLSRRVKRCQECVECTEREFCNTCPARLRAETGAFDKPSAYLCEMAKYFKEVQGLRNLK
jgi:MoaA/NifB/PqqE/SkfB family radical SAM enzyme